ncbi:MarR family transcriptional regulator [Kiloniella laminariae]|uniref:MarR family transcriptional regulator n=1 Tax=Kiloniella laminariae TaxID=454162 RepID=A0ABT4LL78_9PROT|nr:MarR family transcriptional regulator [Kiloniella laminariae]MCZ4281872.1 MarR family transcriptional regulator [Kiloniella laminariae]
MTDIKSGTNPLFLRTDEIMQAIELLFFAYRDFTGEPDELLAEYSFGRAHHRVIHFVGRHPGITVSELLLILRITKQSLSRVLGQLIREGFIRQTPGPVDRRQRLLKLTTKGQELDDKLFDVQRQRIVRAYKESGAEAVAGFRSVLLNMMEENDRKRFSR